MSGIGLDQVSGVGIGSKISVDQVQDTFGSNPDQSLSPNESAVGQIINRVEDSFLSSHLSPSLSPS